MNELFGIPTGPLAIGLVIALAAALAAIGLLALRNRIFLKLGLRNLPRRRGRTALIVAGLMLGTTIIAAALTTGDTMNHTIRSTAVKSLGTTDETVAPKGAADDIPGALGAATGTGWFDARTAGKIASGLAGSDLVDGVTGAIIEQVAVQAPEQRQSEPGVVLFAPDAVQMKGFAAIEGTGRTVSLAELVPGEVYLNRKAASELRVGPGDPVLVFAGGEPTPARVRDIVRFNGSGTLDAALLMPLDHAQRLFGQEGQIRLVLVSNRGDALGGAALSDEVVALLEPIVGPLGLEVETLKQDAIEEAEAQGNAFMSFFTTFGSFSIVAGILLIFLIFVMLAAERRGELGIARAIGTRRGHLVEMFTFEGVAYDLAAAVVGAFLGAVVALGMVLVMASALGAADADEGFQIEYAVSPRSLLIAFAIGVLLTLLVVAVSAWRVSVMTISAAIRNLPEPPAPRRRRRLVLAFVALAIGLAMTVSGAASGVATPLMLGISLTIVSLVPMLRLLGVPERFAFTSCGLAVVVVLMLPWSLWEDVFGQLAMDFGTWIVSGLMIVVGTVWIIVYNADLLLAIVVGATGRIRRLAPVLRMSMAYPLKARFRTGTTLAMFTLVVFTLVTGTVASGSFTHAFGQVDQTGGGFQVRAGTGGAVPIDDMAAALRQARGIRASDFAAVGSQSVLSVQAKQLRTGRPAEAYPVRGLDRSFLEHTTFGLGAMARGYASPREVWTAVRDRPGLAVVDSFVVERRSQFGFAVVPDFKITGFYFEDATFDPVPVEVVDEQTGNRQKLTVIGVLKDTAPFEMVGISTSQRTLETAFPGRVHPTVHYFATAPGVDAEDAAARLESAFLASGLEAQSIQEVVDDAVAASLTFNRLIEGFMGLGLVVGVAALGVISARSVVERRQQIGVLRAIGFRQRMVQATFLLESSFVAVTAIVLGTVLGLLLAWNIIADSREEPSWENLTLVVPWVNLAIIYVVVYAVAMAATLAPAVRASRIRPAEALRYQ